VSAATVKANSCDLYIRVVTSFPAAKERQPRGISSRDLVHCFPSEMNN
jgi:hypothetical protein